MTPNAPIRSLAALSVLCCTVGVQAQSATPQEASPPSPRVLLIDDQFNATNTRLISVTEQGITIEDPSGNHTRLAPETVLALIAIDGPIEADHGIGSIVASERVEPIRAQRIARALAASMRGYLETASGARYPGTVEPTAASGDNVAWAHPLAGRLEIPIDSITRIITAQAAEAGPPIRRSATSDELILANGDVLTGFLLSVGPTTSIETESGNIVDLPIDRVAAALLANPDQPMTGTMVWLDDGSTFPAEALTATDSSGIRVTLAGGNTVEYDPQTLRAIAFEAAGILPLSNLEPRSQEPVGDRVFADPIRTVRHPDDLAFGSGPVLNALDIDMPGPMRVSWTLPSGVVRFAGTAALADTAGGWGDCQLSIELDGERLFSTRLHEAEPVAAFNLKTQGAIELTVVVEPGRYGPVRDRVLLHRPLLQVER